MSNLANPFISLDERLERVEYNTSLILKKLNLSNLDTLTGKSDVDDSSNKYIYGIDGLARLLNCSKPTAHRLKASGKIPFTQIGRKIVFEEEAVMKALGNPPKKGRS